MKEVIPTTEELSVISELCLRFGHDQSNPNVVRNITLCLRAESNDNLKYTRNDQLLADHEVMSYEHFPSAPMTVACLIGYWKTPRANDEMPSGQVAKQAQTLRELGFVFRAEQKSDGTTRNNYTFKLNGKECREIIDFDPKAETKENNWNKLPKKLKTLVRSVHHTDFLGVSSFQKDRQFDHRIPEDVRKREGLKAARLTEASLKDGSYDRDFQVISDKTNYMKREACKACLKGEAIPLPFALEQFRQAFRQRYDESPKKCVGCFWHNHLEPKDENLCPNLTSARAKHQAEVQLVMDKVK